MAAVYAALAALLLLPGLLSGPSLDAAVFTVTASRMARGDLLYVDAWDHKPPGIYLLYAPAQLMLGFLDPWLLSWLIGVLATAALGFLVYRIVFRLGVDGWPAVIAGAAAVVIAAQYLFALGGGLTEPVAAVPAAAALLLALTQRPRPARLALIGGLLGIAVLISLQLAIGAVVIGLLAVVRSERRDRLVGLALGVGGAVIPVVAVAAWLLSTGAADAAIDAVFTYAAAYRSANAGTGADLSTSVAAWSVLALVFLLVPAGIGWLEARRSGGVRAQAALASIAWLVLSVIAFVVQGRFIAHYAIPLAIPLAVLAGLGLEHLRPSPRAILAVPLAAAVGISAVAGTLAGLMEWQAVDATHQQSQAVAAYLQDGSVPSGDILVWGNAPVLYLDARRDVASRYSFLYPLTTHDYSTEAQVQDVLDDLIANPPAAIIDAGSDAPGEPGFLPLLIPRPVATDGRDLDLLDPLRAFVAEHYQMVGEISGWPIYEPIP